MNIPRNKAQALQVVSRALAAGDPVPDQAASWLAAGIAWYLDNEGSSLDEALLLKPTPGGAHETVWAQSRYTRRNASLHRLAASVDGVTWKSAQTISGWLREMAANEGLVPAGLSGTQLLHLTTIYLLNAPVSDSQLWRILRETAYLHETPDYSQVDSDSV